MNIYKIFEKEQSIDIELTTEELLNKFKSRTRVISKKVLLIILVPIICLLVFLINSFNKMQTVTLDINDDFELSSTPIAAVSSKKDVIVIPSGIVKANPFLPYRTINDEYSAKKLINDVPQYDLISPPEFNEQASEAAKVMETAVSGILFDKYNPSAILKIDGNDYLVKKGDTVHNYKVLNIAQNSVTVQHGKNTYKAGIGELLTEGAVNFNDVSNLNKKFGGVQR